jgi:hypothetical protein
MRDCIYYSEIIVCSNVTYFNEAVVVEEAEHGGPGGGEVPVPGSSDTGNDLVDRGARLGVEVQRHPVPLRQPPAPAAAVGSDCASLARDVLMRDDDATTSRRNKVTRRWMMRGGGRRGRWRRREWGRASSARSEEEEGIWGDGGGMEGGYRQVGRGRKERDRD